MGGRSPTSARLDDDHWAKWRWILRRLLVSVFCFAILELVCLAQATAPLPDGAIAVLGSKMPTAMQFSPDGAWLAIGTREGIELRKCADLGLVRLFVGHTSYIRSVAFSQDSRILASGSDDKTIRLWDVETGQKLDTFAGLEGVVRSIAFSPDGMTLASVVKMDFSDTRKIKLWDVETGQELHTLGSFEDPVRSIAFSPDGRWLTASFVSYDGLIDGIMRLWDVQTGQELTAESRSMSPVQSVAFCSTGELLASGCGDGTIRLWDVETGEEIRTLTGHTGSVSSVAFSPNGKRLASGSRDKTIRLWDVATGKELRTLIGHMESVNSVAFSPNGRLLASGAYDDTVKLWDAETGQELRTLTGHTSSVESVAFSPKGRLLASGSNDETIKLWDVETGEELRTLAGHTKGVTSVAFSPDGEILASGSLDNTIKLWDTATGEELRILNDYTRWGHCVAFSQDGELIAAGCDDGTVRLRYVDTGEELHVLIGHTDWVRSVAFSPNGRLLASCSGGDLLFSGSYSEPIIRLWDVEAGKELRRLTGHTSCINSMAFSPDGRFLASGADDKTIKLWDVGTGQELLTLAGGKERVCSVAFSPDGGLLISLSADGIHTLWDVRTASMLRPTSGYTERVESVAFSPDGRLLAAGSENEMIILWDIETEKVLRTLTGHTDRVVSVTFSPDGSILASGSWDNTIKLWDVGTGKELRTLSGHTARVRSVAFSPDGKVLASGADDKIKLWGVETGEEVRTFTRSAGSVAFSPDGKTLVSCTSYNIRLWDVITGEELHTLTWYADIDTDLFKSSINSVAFSPDGALLASGACDDTISLWDVSTGRELCTRTGHTDDVTSVAFSPDGSVLASGSWDDTIKLWDVATGRELSTLSGGGNTNPNVSWLSSGGDVDSVVFSPDGSILASGSDSGEIFLWDVDRILNSEAVRRVLAEPSAIGNPARTDAVFQEGVNAYTAGDHVRAIPLLEEALTAYRAIGDCVSEVRVLSYLALCWKSSMYADRLMVAVRNYADEQESLAYVFHEYWEDDPASREVEARTLQKLGQRFSFQKDYAEALECHTEAASLFHGLGLAGEEAENRQAVGQCHYKLQEFSEAATSFERAYVIFLELGDDERATDCTQKLGDCYFSLSHYRAARSYYEEVLAFNREHGGVSDQAHSLEQIGDCYRELQEYDKAIEHYNEANSLRGSMTWSSTKQTLWKLSICYKGIGDYEKAIALGEKSLSYHRSVFNRSGEAMDLNNLGVIYVYLGEYQRAIDYYKQSLMIWRALDEEHPENMAITLSNLGACSHKLRQYKAAVSYWESALELWRNLDDQERVVTLLGWLAWAQVKLGESEAAVDGFIDALAALDKIPQVGGLAYDTAPTRWMLLTNLGVCYEQVGQPDLAQESYEQAVEIAESVRGALTVEEERRLLLDRVDVVYWHLVDLLIRENKGTAAFPYVERCLARTFLDTLAKGPVDRPEKSLEPGIASGTVDAEQIQTDIQAVITSLPPLTVVLEYFITQSSSYVWAVTRDGISKPVALPCERSELMDKVIACRQRLEEPSLTVNRDLANLYDWLIRPVQNLLPLPADLSGGEVPHLVIVPSGPLHYLPFQALLWTSLDRTHHEPLIKRYSVSYAPSLTSLLHLNKPAPEAACFLGLADPSTARPRLPEAQIEVKEVAAAFDCAKVYLGNAATEEVIDSEPDRATFLLVATHGSFNVANPVFSYLVLDPTEVKDGKLCTYEVAALSLKATDLVVLSACETLLPGLESMKRQIEQARGKNTSAPTDPTEEQLSNLTRGDELVGLTRAFLTAGASSVLSSLWSVPSDATTSLIVGLYRGIWAGLDKGDALRQAELEVMGNPLWRDPVYWAAFNLMGDWR